MDEIMIVYFQSQDQEINHVAIRCLQSDTNDNITSIDLGECETLLRNYYNIKN